MKRRKFITSVVSKALIASCFSFFAVSSYAAKDDIVENKLNRTDALIDKQNKIAGYIDFYIYTTGKVPSSIRDLVRANLISSNISDDFNGLFNITNNNIISISNTLENVKQYEIDYYKNNLKGAYALHNPTLNTSTGRGTFRSQYPLSSEAKKSLILSRRGYIVSMNQPNASSNNGKFWYDPLSHAVSFSKGGRWVSLQNVKNFYVVRDAAELPSNVINGDIAVVVKPNLFEKYIYVNGEWQRVPQNIPFNYNGQF